MRRQEKGRRAVVALMEVDVKPFAFERATVTAQTGVMSPGSIYGNRLTLGTDKEADIFFASGNALHRLSLGPAPALPEMPKNYHGQFLLPAPSDRIASTSLVEPLNGAANHACEIQNIHSVGDQLLRLYSVDSSGHCLINTFSQGQHIATAALEAPIWTSDRAGLVQIAAHALFPSLVVTARYSDKLVTVYDQDRAISKFKAVGHPIQTRVLENGLLVMIEQGSYSVWDLRLPQASISSKDGVSQQTSGGGAATSSVKVAGVGSSGACVQRVCVSTEPLYALDVSGTRIGVGGADRDAFVCDIRSEGPLYRWKGALKYDITRFLFSKSDSSLCFVSGLDNELLVGKCDGSVALSHFDGPHIESHWIGLCNQNDSDDVYGLAQSGHVYICKNLPSLLDFSSATSRRSQTGSPRAESSTPQQPHQRQQKKKKAEPPPTKKAKTHE